jgi:hypothetical protein
LALPGIRIFVGGYFGLAEGAVGAGALACGLGNMLELELDIAGSGSSRAIFRRSSMCFLTKGSVADAPDDLIWLCVHNVNWLATKNYKST